MSSKNPWQKRTSGMPRYDKPREIDPFARFSKMPNSLLVVDNFRRTLVNQGIIDSERKIPAKYRNDLIANLAPLEEPTSLDDLKDDRSVIAYKKRAVEHGRLTRDELISLVEHSIDNVVYGKAEGAPISGKDITDLRNEFLDKEGEKYDKTPDAAMLQPVLVNVSWTYESTGEGTRKSPSVVYSIEGVFYGVDEEDVLVAAHEFLVNHIRPAVSGGGDRVIDMSQNPDGDADKKTLMESAGAEIAEGGGVSKGDAREMIFDPQVRAFYTRKNGKVSMDDSFRDPGIRYRIVKGRFEIA
jgi:hypothetical protein